MGTREIKNFFNEGKNKNLFKIQIVHMGFLQLFGVYLAFDWLFSPNFDNWPTILVEIISTGFIYYAFTAILYGLLGIFFIYLGILSYKDFKLYIFFFILNIVILTLGSFDVSPFKDFGLYLTLIFWVIILITSLMNRFNNMSDKINEIHDKLNKNLNEEKESKRKSDN